MDVANHVILPIRLFDLYDWFVSLREQYMVFEKSIGNPKRIDSDPPVYVFEAVDFMTVDELVCMVDELIQLEGYEAASKIPCCIYPEFGEATLSAGYRYLCFFTYYMLQEYSMVTGNDHALFPQMQRILCAEYIDKYALERSRLEQLWFELNDFGDF